MALKVNQVVVQRNALNLSFNLNVVAGGLTALCGESGIGKTTLLDVIAGFVSPSSGEIYWQESEITDTSPERRPVSYLFQSNNLFDHITVRQNLVLGFGKVKVPWAELTKALEAMGVADQLNKYPTELSGGQKQRVALVRSVLRPEPILLLDEPLSGLDVGLRQRALGWITDQVRQSAKTLIMVTHHPDELADNFDILELGRP